MAVPCPHCGREYDVSLFEFGRTIWCTCGNRVGIEPRVQEVGRAGDKRFVADAMLGRLARWLRLLGFDCLYDPEATDEEVARLSMSQGRILLTRDRRLPDEWWVPDVYLVNEQEVRKQLAEVIRRFDLADSIRVLSRCNECNRPLRRVARSEVAGRVPARILDTHEVFFECRGCGRVFWEGSHAVRIRLLVEELIAAA